MISVRIITDAVRDDGKTCAEKGQVGLVDSKEWDGQGGTVRVLLAGKKNRATVPREACRAIRFGLWDSEAHEFIVEGAEPLGFDDPRLAGLAAAETDLVVSELIPGAWAPPEAYSGLGQTMVAQLCALDCA